MGAVDASILLAFGFTSGEWRLPRKYSTSGEMLTIVASCVGKSLVTEALVFEDGSNEVTGFFKPY